MLISQAIEYFGLLFVVIELNIYTAVLFLCNNSMLCPHQRVHEAATGRTVGKGVDGAKTTLCVGLTTVTVHGAVRRA